MKKKLIVISIDAMIYEDLEHMKKLKYLGDIIKKGSIIKTSQTVYPSLTYTAHASMISGTYPDKHGIINNEIFNPYVKFGDWYEKRDQIKTQILPEICEKNGYVTLINSWPTMAEADVTYNLQRAGIHQVKEGKKEAMIENSTPGLMKKIWDVCEDAWKLDKYYDSDKFSGLASAYLIKEKNPDVIFMHMTLVDHYRHVYGVYSKKIQNSLEFIDEMLGYVVEALKEKGIYEQTNFLICSDHGQVDIQQSINVNQLFIEKGWLKVDEDYNVLEWDVYCHSAAASAQIYVKDDAVKNQVYQLLDENRELLQIEEIFTNKEVQKQFNLKGDFDFVIESKKGSAFNYILSAPLKQSAVNEDYRTSRGTHGHLPTRGSQPYQILSGPDFVQGLELDFARNIDIAPTCAALLGLEMPYADGEVIKSVLK